MRRLTLALTTALLLLLSSCSFEGNAESDAWLIRDEYAAADSFSLTALITADYGDNIYEFKVRYTGSKTSGTLDILEPQNISGVSASIDAEKGVTLLYDGAELFTGYLSESGLSPMDAIPVMLSRWGEGYIAECSYEDMENEGTAVAIVTGVSDTVTLRTLFDKKTHLPVSAALDSEGYTVIYCIFENVVID